MAASTFWAAELSSVVEAGVVSSSVVEEPDSALSVVGWAQPTSRERVLTVAAVAMKMRVPRGREAEVFIGFLRVVRSAASG